MVGRWLNREVNLVFLSEVPEPLIVKVQPPNVVASDFANFLSIFVDFAPNIVLLFHEVAAEVDKSCDFVLFVTPLKLSDQLVTKGTHEKAIDLVTDNVCLYFTSVWERYFLLTNVINIG